MSHEDRRAKTDSATGASSPVPGSAAVEAWLVSWIGDLLEIEPAEIDVRRPFTYYGLSSADAVGLAGDLEDWLGCRLPATLAWDYPSIQLLARFLGGQEDETPGRERECSGERFVERLLTEIESLSDETARQRLAELKR